MVTLLPKIKLPVAPVSMVFLIPTMPVLLLLITFSLPKTLAFSTSLKMDELPFPTEPILL